VSARPAALSSASRNAAVVAGILDSVGFGVEVDGPLAKLLPNVVSDRNTLQLAASISHCSKFSCLHGG
jgi:hypothetical protein